MLGLQAVQRLRIPDIVPVDGGATWATVARKCGVDVIHLRRLLRHAMTNHIFEERDDRIVHTAASKVLLENAMMRDILGLMCEEMFPSATKVGDCSF